MDTTEARHQPDAIHATCKMSWTAYIRPVFVFLILVLIGVCLISYVWIASAVFVFALVLLIFNVLSIRSVKLYTDDDGVWVYSGIFPWSKGTNGVKWRDLEDAVFFTGFFSWLFKSYSIRVGHRFTKTSEIVLPHIAHGDEIVIHINELHRQILSGSAIE